MFEIKIESWELVKTKSVNERCDWLLNTIIVTVQINLKKLKR